MWPSTPAERRHLAWRCRTCCLRRFRASRPPQNSSFRGSIPHPIRSLCTLRIRRRRRLRNTRFPAVRYRLTGAGLSPAGSRQLRLTHRNWKFESISLERRVRCELDLRGQANVVARLPRRSQRRRAACPSKCDETSAQCLAQIHDQVVGILNPDRNANQRGRDPQAQPFFFRNVRMSHRGRMRSESLRTTQAYRELDHFKPIQDSKGFGLTSLHFEAESGAWTLALVLKDWTIGMALRQESQIPNRCDLRMSIEEACDLARAFRRGRHSELQGLE